MTSKTSDSVSVGEAKPLAAEELKWVRPPPGAQVKGPVGHGLHDFKAWSPPETVWDKAKRKTKANPLVPIGVLMTTAALTYGLISMRRGNQKMSQHMMRARVAAQGFTVAAMVIGALYVGSAK